MEDKYFDHFTLKSASSKCYTYDVRMVLFELGPEVQSDKLDTQMPCLTVQWI